MLINRLFYLGLLPAIISGCAQTLPFLTGKQPAPVYESQPVVYPDPEPVAQPPVAKKIEPAEPTPDIEINPVVDSSNTVITPIELPPEITSTEPTQPLLTPEQEKELAILEKSATQEPNAATTATPNPQSTTAPAATTPPVATDTSPAAIQQLTNVPPVTTPETATNPPSTPATLSPPATPNATEVAVAPPPAPPPPPPPPPFEPLENFGSLSPVVSTLILAANKSAGKNVELATTTIERAIRIEPRNPVLFYKLACYRLKQSKPDFALVENLAKKSALLAGNDKELKKSSWLLIAHARDKQNNPDGAKEARKKAEKL